MLYRNGVGVRIEPESDTDANTSWLSGNGLYAVRCKQSLAFPGKRRKALDRVAEQIETGALEALRAGVLGLRDWSDLDERVARVSRGETP